MAGARWTVRHYDWCDVGEPYGWHTLRDGQVIDTYSSRELAEAYADYMNTRNEGGGSRMPGEYDGYLTETEEGWEVAAAGEVVAKHPDEEVARAILSEYGAGRPCWKVTRDGRATRLTVS